MIDGIAVAELPRLGRLVMSGPSFRYISTPGAHGQDSFKLKVDGASLRVKGSSLIEVDVSIE
ncbi:MAG: hypothetical protein EKK33_11825 [Bradyrhizobiaceae bacterium]|nr:MAG: hypothetical protein EKK33_11825 [Bradyrhizobiaceae bacterium]